jgi:hypothetical protein
MGKDEKGERAVRDSRESGVVMMAVAVEDGGGGWRWQRRITIAAEDKDMWDRAADYNGEGKERVVREGGDSGVAMIAAVADGDSGGQRWRWWTTTATADDDSADDEGSGWWRHARSSGWLQGGRRRAGGK